MRHTTQWRLKVKELLLSISTFTVVDENRDRIKGSNRSTLFCKRKNYKNRELHLKNKKELDKKRGKNDPCSKSIKKALEGFKKLDDNYFNKLFKNAMKHCKNKK